MIDDKEELGKKLSDWLAEAREHSEDWRKEAREDYDFVSGRQYTDDDLKFMQRYEMPAAAFDQIRSAVDAVCGAEIQARNEVAYLPRQEGDTQIAELPTAAAKWVRDQCDAEDEESEAFRDMLVCGMGWTETRMCYDDNIQGDIIEERFDPLEAFWDPRAKKQNLDDAQFVGREQMWKKETVEERFGDGAADHGSEERALSVPPISTSDPSDDYGNRSNSSRTKVETGEGRIAVRQFQWWEKIPFFLVQNHLGGFDLISPIDFENLRRQLERVGMPMFPHQKIVQRVYFQAFMVGGRVVECGILGMPKSDAPINDQILQAVRARKSCGFTLRCQTGHRDRNKNHWFGIVRAMKDPQRWLNRWLSQALHIVNTSSKGGVMVEQSALIDGDEKEFEESWAHNDRVTHVADGALSGGRVKPKPQVGFPAAYDRLIQYAAEAIPMAGGVNKELLGLVGHEQTGVLEYTRKQAGYAMLAPFFNALRRFRKEQGRVLLHFIREYISDGRLVRLTDAGNIRYIRLLRDKMVQDYDLVIDEVATSPNQKQQVWSQLQPMLPYLMNLGLPLPAWMVILRYSGLPSAAINEFQKAIESMAPDPKQVAMQERAQTAEISKTESQAFRDMTAGMLNQAKITEVAPNNGLLNEVMKLAEIRKTDSQANELDARARQHAMPNDQGGR